MIDASRQCSMTGTMTPSGRAKRRIGRSVRESICSRPMAYGPRPPAVRVGLMPYLSEFHQGLALTPLCPLALAPRPAHVFSDFESSQPVPRQVEHSITHLYRARFSTLPRISKASLPRYQVYFVDPKASCQKNTTERSLRRRTKNLCPKLLRVPCPERSKNGNGCHYMTRSRASYHGCDTTCNGSLTAYCCQPLSSSSLPHIECRTRSHRRSRIQRPFRLGVSAEKT
jgi:hypothetical protein